MDTNRPLHEGLQKNLGRALLLEKRQDYTAGCGGCVGSVSNGKVNVLKNSGLGKLP